MQTEHAGASARGAGASFRRRRGWVALASARLRPRRWGHRRVVSLRWFRRSWAALAVVQLGRTGCGAEGLVPPEAGWRRVNTAPARAGALMLGAAQLGRTGVGEVRSRWRRRSWLLTLQVALMETWTLVNNVYVNFNLVALLIVTQTFTSVEYFAPRS